LTHPDLFVAAAATAEHFLLPQVDGFCTVVVAAAIVNVHFLPQCSMMGYRRVEQMVDIKMSIWLLVVGF
jgi:hypothetical protein